MIFFKKLIRKKDNNLFIIDYAFADFFLRIFSLFWVTYVVFSYQENNARPISLYKPVIWFQEWFLSSLPSPVLFYSIVLITCFLCVYTIVNKNILYRTVLFFLLLWLNTIKWNYNFFSHVGHLFLLAHFFTIFIPSKNIDTFTNYKDKKSFSLAIRWAYAGVLVTYSLAGFWKFSSLFYKTIFKSNAINWLSEDAVELNAIVSARIWDEQISKTMLNIYEIPYIWEIGTFFIFLIQFIAVLGAFNKRMSYFILTFLLIFHIYNMLFINTHFYVASFVLIILLFPYHKFTSSKTPVKF